MPVEFVTAYEAFRRASQVACLVLCGKGYLPLRNLCVVQEDDHNTTLQRKRDDVALE
jgi:hypothetical protein